ncbi:MAG: hypothetical protein RLZZ303_1725 [Candidatus Hydrogenedentota bacterium]|jgi:GNAT superfamily N-acetyltransferase
MGANIRIRMAVESDLSALPAIEDDAAHAFAEVGYGFCAGLPGQSVEALRLAMREGALLVAEAGEEGRLAGFAQVWRTREAAHLRELNVLRASQKQGIGRALLEGVALWARETGLSMVTLTTFRDVPWNAPWYARMGFEVVNAGELPDDLLHRLAPELALDRPEYPRVTMRMRLRVR